MKLEDAYIDNNPWKGTINFKVKSHHVNVPAHSSQMVIQVVLIGLWL